MKEAKAEVIRCKYCGTKVNAKDEMCSNCRAKKKLMRGWHWLYKGKEIIKENEKNEKN